MNENGDIPCAKICDRPEHGDFINAALTKRSIGDEELCSFIDYTCALCGSSKDIYGRSGLHMAASCGRTVVCKWLICQKQGKINDKDIESGYTPLHRSIFYGKIDTAVALIQLGGNMKIMDSNDLTPLDHAMQDNLIPFNELHTPLIYVWGSNSNYTLGPNQSRHVPEILDSFHKSFPLAEASQVCLEKYHTLIVTNKGCVYSFGNGQGGRLGTGSEKTILEPAEVKFASSGHAGNVQIAHCAIARDHCIFLTETQEVWTCGLNTHHVLGIIPPPTQLLNPRPVKIKASILGVACGRYHSVAWNSNAVYTWGFNGGQLGHDKTNDKTVIAPKAVTCISSQNRRIISVAASNGATAIATDKGDVYMLHEYQCRAVASKNLGIVSVEVYGGRLATVDERREDLKLLAITKTGNILVWQESDPQLCRCTFSLNRLIKVRQARLTAFGLMILTDEREIFNGKFKARKRKSAPASKKHFNNFLERNECVSVQIEKVQRIYGADRIACDLEGLNFAALHVNTSTALTLLPEISDSTFLDDLAKLTNDDIIDSDINFKVGNRLFSGHSYIIAHSSSKLLALITGSNSDQVIISTMEPEIFQEIVDYMYFGTCSLLHEGPVPQNLMKFCRKPNKTLEGKNIASKKQESAEIKTSQICDPLRLLQEAAKRFGINSLHKDLNHFVLSGGQIKLKDNQYRPRLVTFRVDAFPELQDTRIRAQCGKLVGAHKCILAARCEFFANRFSMRWLNDSDTEIELPFSIDCIRHLIDYLYTDQVDLEHSDIDHILSLLVLADHMLLDRLVEVCEFRLSALITLKNVLQFLTLADMYNAVQLKAVCMEYVCLNLAWMLESRHLEQLDSALLDELTRFYGTWNRRMQQRVITPFSEAATDEMVRAVSAQHPVRMDFGEIVKMPAQKAHRRRNRTMRASDSGRHVETSASDGNIPLEVTDGARRQDNAGDDARGRTKELEIGAQAMPARISAICNAHARIHEAYDDEVPVLLSSEFPDLGSSFGSPEGSHFTPKATPKQKVKMVRLSQRERKRLSSSSCTDAEPVSECAESPPVKNYWNTNFESPILQPTIIGNIINEEKKQRENLSRIRRKLLIYTQMEDKALSDLEKFYNVENVFDEVIQVHRVDCGEISAPLWVHK